VLINTTSFAMGEVNAEGATQASWAVEAFEQLDIPVLQAITSSMTQAQWEQSERGLNPLDTAMNVALPEFDGRIIGVPVSFKPEDPASSDYQPLPDRMRRLAGIAARLARLKHTPAATSGLPSSLPTPTARPRKWAMRWGWIPPPRCMRCCKRCRPMAMASAPCRTAATR
jgi:hypothetical protein